MLESKHPRLVLASASPRRLQLLKQIDITPHEVVAADIDETPRKGELPAIYAQRVAEEKATSIAKRYPDAVVLAADTVVACGRRILPKAEDETSARKCLSLLSGRRHRVYTAVCVISGGKTQQQTVQTHVRFSRLSAKDITAYIASGQWQGKAGGYAIQGVAEVFIPWIGGSFSNVVGLPLAETRAMLIKAGIVREHQ
jgi:septum formation protein